MRSRPGYIYAETYARSIIIQAIVVAKMNTYPISAYSDSVFKSYYGNGEVQAPPLHRTPHCVYTVSECEEPVQVVTIDACPIIKTRVVTTTRKVVYTSPYQIFV